jgi:ubiquinone/menaquinone biosynthesis C-methylase UbiE
MVTADPLYLLDRSDNNLTALLNNYPAEYIQRLRVYTVEEDYSILPQGQFGCITCCNFLNLYDLSNIEQFLDKFNKLLRPGGKLICNLHFSYNDSTAKLVDKKYFNYTINLIINKIFNNMGYIISSNELSLEGNISMLITAQKPGTLTTSKAHQVLGSIIEK